MIHLHSALLPLNPTGVCNNMSYMKRLLENVIELYDEGYTLSKIAELTELPVDEVDRILSEYHDCYVPVY